MPPSSHLMIWNKRCHSGVIQVSVRCYSGVSQVLFRCQSGVTWAFLTHHDTKCIDMTSDKVLPQKRQQHVKWHYLPQCDTKRHVVILPEITLRCRGDSAGALLVLASNVCVDDVISVLAVLGSIFTTTGLKGSGLPWSIKCISVRWCSLTT